MFWSLLVATTLAAPVTLKASDGQALHAEVNGKGERALLFVHADERSHTDWQFFTKTVNDLGYRTLAIDLRGHGKSSLSQDIGEEDYLAMPLDGRWRRVVGEKWCHPYHSRRRSIGRKRSSCRSR